MRGAWKAAATSAGLSALFVGVYGFCNVITSLRPHVGSLYFAWERAIPFVPALILPYLSIDLFFIAAPFLARSDRERSTFARRIVAAILIAGVCFLLFPLRFAFERPPVEGFVGVIFNRFRTLDPPFNEFPSLHVALWLILFQTYFRRFKGVLRVGVVIWLVLIGISPLVTYQHHVVDILGGLGLGVFCLHFVGKKSRRQQFTPNRRIGGYYLLAAALLILLALTWGPWTYLLLWPAGALSIVAAGYLFLGPGIFRKDRGMLPWTTWLLLAPVLLGQRLSLRYYARQCRPWDQLTERLWIGRRLSTAEARQLRAKGVIAVVDLAVEFSEPSALRELAYLQLPVLDLTAPTPYQIEGALEFIHKHAAHGAVYLHCKIGYSRTAAIAGAYLLATHQAGTVEEALAILRQVRPSIIVRPEAVSALQMYQARYAVETPQSPTRG